MAKKGFTPEQIINKLREVELLLRQGATIATVSKSIGVSTHTYYRLRKEYGGLRADQAKKLKTLEKENARLKKLVADLSLDNAILKEVAAAKFDALVDDGFKDQTRETNVSKMFVSQENSPESINRFESEPPGSRTRNLLIKSQVIENSEPGTELATPPLVTASIKLPINPTNRTTELMFVHIKATIRTKQCD